MNCGKTQEESKFLSSCVSAWSPVHWHSLLHSPLCCRHLVCRSPWQWVSVPPFFHLSASHDFSLSAALLVLKPVLIYESSRITWARLKAGDIAQDLTQQLDDLSCQKKTKKKQGLNMLTYKVDDDSVSNKRHAWNYTEFITHRKRLRRLDSIRVKNDFNHVWQPNLNLI